mgnify:CR=1 FL=1|jgi:alkaline phosphatase D
MICKLNLMCLLSCFIFAENMINEMPYAKIEKDAIISRIALGSCFAPQVDSDIWTEITKYNPEIFLYLGDNVYQSEESNELALPHLKEAYQLLADLKTFDTFRQEIPILPIWDDHDYGMNDAGASYPPRYKSEKLFEQFWRVSIDDPRRSRDGIYFAQTFGLPGQQLQIIMLDTRFFRTDIQKISTDQGKKEYQPNLTSKATMLGEVQWQWLVDKLKEPADVRLIVSSVQILASEGDHEGWYLFPKERERLLSFFNNINGIILISGDRHFSAFYQTDKITGVPLLELTSSSLNLPITGNTRTKMEPIISKYQLEKGVFDENFSTINIDWSLKQVTLAIRSKKNVILQERTIKIPQ